MDIIIMFVLITLGTIVLFMAVQALRRRSHRIGLFRRLDEIEWRRCIEDLRNRTLEYRKNSPYYGA